MADVDVTGTVERRKRGPKPKKLYRCTHKTKIWLDGFTMTFGDQRRLTEKQAAGHPNSLELVE